MAPPPPPPVSFTAHKSHKKYQPNSRQVSLSEALKDARKHILDGSGHLIGGGFLRRNRAHSLISPPGIGKTLVSVHAILSLHTGEPFFGHPVERSRCILFACEAAASTLDRLVIAAHRRGLTWPLEGVDVLPIPVDFKNDDDRSWATEAIRASNCSAFFVDTANASGAGAEDSYDMPAYAGAINQIVVDSNAAAFVNHHTPLSDGQRERGHTSFRGMLDTSIILREAVDGSDTRTLIFGKQRDRGTNLFGQFRIEAHELGVTNLGETWSVPYLVELETRPISLTKKPTHTDRLLAIIKHFGASCPDRVRTHFFRTFSGQHPDTARRSYDRALDTLQALGKIDISDETITFLKD